MYKNNAYAGSMLRRNTSRHRRFGACQGYDGNHGAPQTEAVAPLPWAILDEQRIAHCAYYQDRGPVSVDAMRLHAHD